MPDRYESSGASLSSPAYHGFAVTPADATDLPEVTRALYVGTAGALRVTLASEAVVTLTNVAAGSLLPLRVTRVHATGSTAGDVVGLS
ncbi:spike base protein, RCAP_Rcc01079 family [Roseibium aestuarii]|uniref:Uncharacterized protein n=1 Tax=Roseibium aestuarii TaxID=2600299 RepID=A0ABW4JR97_9HYPH|nr:hypothetical protein [Roseibium aestuarii]